jgi:hypothetical protein
MEYFQFQKVGAGEEKFAGERYALIIENGFS